MAIQVPAIEFQQGNNKLYTIVIDVKQVDAVADADTLRRNDKGELEGFQRGEVAKHIKGIKEYLESPNPMIPNALVLGFPRKLKFTPLEPKSNVGILTLPDGKQKCGTKVDGQQRTAAGRDANIESFLMPATVFIAEDAADFREHFVRVNSSKPLGREMLYSLLPGIDASINAELDKKRIPVLLRDRLSMDDNSPLRGLIKSSTSKDGVISDTTMLRGIEESILRGYLWQLRGQDAEDLDSMVTVMKNFWTAVRDTWGEAWHAGPKFSRLFHAASVISLFEVMDSLCESYPKEKLTVAFFKKGMKPLESWCAWTEGNWDFGPDGVVPWNGIENTTRGIRRLKDGFKNKMKKAVTATVAEVA